jgi:hypothetical protein
MSRRLVFGSVSRSRLVGLAPLGVVNGRPVFPIHCAEDDNPADDGDDGADNDGADPEEDDDDQDDDAKNKDRNRRRPARGRGSDYNAIRRERNALLKDKKEREEKERAADLATKSEVDRVTIERDDAVKERDSLRDKLSAATVQLEIIKSSSSKYNWVDIEDVLNDRTLRDAIEIGDDGVIEGVAEALKDLAKRKPHYLAAKPDDKNDSGNGSNSNGGNSNANKNGKSGGNPGTGDNGNLAANRERLNALYPAIARLPQ